MNILKRILVTLFITGFMFLPMCVKAEENTYTTLNLDEALNAEEIEHDFSNYKETDKQAVIYLFRGQGCGFCRKFLTFLNSIVDEYGKYFRVVSYEVWNDQNNNDLLSRVSAVMKQDATGVPYIVIGDKVFTGYAESYDEDIKSKIKELYDTPVSDRYDVMQNLGSVTAVDDTKKDESSNFSLIIFNIIFTIAACTIIVVYQNKKRIELENRILLLEGKKVKKNEK